MHHFHSIRIWTRVTFDIQQLWTTGRLNWGTSGTNTSFRRTWGTTGKASCDCRLQERASTSNKFNQQRSQSVTMLLRWPWQVSRRPDSCYSTCGKQIACSIATHQTLTTPSSTHLDAGDCCLRFKVVVHGVPDVIGCTHQHCSAAQPPDQVPLNRLIQVPAGRLTDSSSISGGQHDSMTVDPCLTTCIHSFMQRATTPHAHTTTRLLTLQLWYAASLAAATAATAAAARTLSAHQTANIRQRCCCCCPNRPYQGYKHVMKGTT